MRTLALTTFSSFVFAVCNSLLSPALAQDAATTINKSASAVGPEALIRKQIESYIQAFNAGDADAVASHWTKNGEFATASGVVLQGHDALMSSFAKYFSDTASTKIELVEPQIEVLSPNVAREVGTARVIAAEQEPSETDYEAMYVKTEAGWKLDSVREHSASSAPASHYEQLRTLEWLVGTWVDDSPNAQIETTCRWTTNQNFLVRSFKVYIEDRVDFEGTQVIGWDPSTEKIRSWMFDSDGGFGTGVWSENGNGWTVHTLNILPDGKRASATHIFAQLDDNSLEFRSIGRQVDGELLPSIEPIKIVRRDEQPLSLP